MYFFLRRCICVAGGRIRRLTQFTRSRSYVVGWIPWRAAVRRATWLVSHSRASHAPPHGLCDWVFWTLLHIRTLLEAPSYINLQYWMILVLKRLPSYKFMQIYIYVMCMYSGVRLKTEIIQYLRRFVYEREIMELQCSLCLDWYKISRL